MVTEFKGTLFRFPLRTKTQAKTSKLSHANYDGGSITVLLNKFAQEKTLDLLFLKNVTRVEILHWHEGTAVPSFVASSAITNPGPTLSVARGAFARASAAHASVGADATIDPPQSSNFEVCFFSQGNGGGVSGSDGDTTRQFAVSQALGTSLQPLVTQGRERFGMRLVPWAAVAAELPGANLTEGTALGLSQIRHILFLPPLFQCTTRDVCSIASTRDVCSTVHYVP
jgi:sacsin